MTQGHVGEMIGVTRQAISAYEAGEKSPDSETFTRIVDVLEQPPSLFYDRQPLLFLGSKGRGFSGNAVQKHLRKNEACEILGRWFVQTVKYYDEYVNFPAVHILEATPQKQHRKLFFRGN